jgi:hypothetical protein
MRTVILLKDSGSNTWPLIVATIVGPFVGSVVGASVALALQRKSTAAQLASQRAVLAFEQRARVVTRLVASVLGPVTTSVARAAVEYRRAMTTNQWQDYVDTMWALVALVSGALNAEVKALESQEVDRAYEDVSAAVVSQSELWPIRSDVSADLDALAGGLAMIERALEDLRAETLLVERGLRQ